MENDEYEFDGFIKQETKKKDVNMSQDYETIITLSTNPEIVANKKIQQIRTTIDILIKDFTLNETIEIHSIYNHNASCLQNRSKFLLEFNLIIAFLDHKGISFSSNILPIVFPSMIISQTKKVVKKNDTRIKSQYTFENFIQEEEEDKLFSLLKRYASGLFFYIKNLILKKRDRGEDEEELLKILMINPESTFINDKRLNEHVSWFAVLMMRIVLFNLKNIYFTNEGFNGKKTVEFHSTFALRVVLKWLIEDSLQMRVFLTYDSHPLFKDLITNKKFRSIIEDVLIKFKKEKTLKRFNELCEKTIDSIIQQIYKKAIQK